MRRILWFFINNKCGCANTMHTGKGLLLQFNIHYLFKVCTVFLYIICPFRVYSCLGLKENHAHVHIYRHDIHGSFRKVWHLHWRTAYSLYSISLNYEHEWMYLKEKNNSKQQKPKEKSKEKKTAHQNARTNTFRLSFADSKYSYGERRTASMRNYTKMIT